MDFSLLFSEIEQIAPRITESISEEMPDDPALLRWRAWWNKGWDGKMLGVELRCYPVVRKTPKGAWIDPHGYRQWGSGKMEWAEPRKELLRWVSNDGGQAWAKQTRQDAIDSLIYRHKRWAIRILNDITYFMGASNALSALFPDKADQADMALRNLLFTVREGKRP